MSVADVSIFAGKEWKVHKFGGTSVANAECFLKVARIIEDSLGAKNGSAMIATKSKPGSDDMGPTNNKTDHDDVDVDDEDQSTNSPNLAIVVSAMGGKPKTTDLLLSTVSSAAAREEATVQATIQQLLDKHTTCLEILFADLPSEKDRLMATVEKDLQDIQDILKTVALMKWQAERISELVSGYGELWSTQILQALLQMRSRNRSGLMGGSGSGSSGGPNGDADPNSPVANLALERHESLSMDADADDHVGMAPSAGHHVTHEFYYVDARRVIILDEDAIQDGAICWGISQTKLQDIYQEAYNNVHPDSIVHLVMTGYVASNTNGVATTLQRDGSDYSAAILGRLLNATQINIWTDVDGCLSADPRRVPGAYVIPDVSYTEGTQERRIWAQVLFFLRWQDESTNLLLSLYQQWNFHTLGPK